MDKLGKVVKENRERRGETREDLARIIGCRPSFVRHIEHSSKMAISERVIKELKKHFRSAKDEIEKSAKKRNACGNDFYKKRREALS